MAAMKGNRKSMSTSNVSTVWGHSYKIFQIQKFVIWKTQNFPDLWRIYLLHHGSSSLQWILITLCLSVSFQYSTKNRQAVLQSLLTLSREYPEKCNWEEYFKPVLLRLLDLMGDSDTTVKLYSLRVLREMLKTQHERLKDYSELTTLKVLKCFTDSDSTVSWLYMYDLNPLQYVKFSLYYVSISF